MTEQELQSEAEVAHVDFMGDIEAFHVKFNQEYNGKARVLPRSLFDFRVKFIQEEFHEYEGEQDILEDEMRMELGLEDDEAIVRGLELQLDALVDLTYVVLGTAYLQFGSERFREAWRRVVTANMSKVLAGTVEGSVDSGRDPKHDVVKPPGWTAPSHRDLVLDFDRGRVRP